MRFVTTSGRVKFLQAFFFLFRKQRTILHNLDKSTESTPSVILLSNYWSLNHSIKFKQKANQIADINAFTLFYCFTNLMSTFCQRVKRDFLCNCFFNNLCFISFIKSDSRNFAPCMWQSYQVHCYHTLFDAADSVITSVTFIQSQLLDVFRHPKTIPGAEERKKEQHGQPSHDGRYADHAVQISLATNLGLFKIITIDFTNISHNWFSGASGKWFSGHQI